MSIEGILPVKIRFTREISLKIVDYTANYVILTSLHHNISQ
jgi:hypothetical protein